MGGIITLFSSFAGGTEDSEMSFDVPMNTAIVGVKWAVRMDFDADTEVFTAQLGFGPTLVATTDSRSPIDTINSQLNLTTSGANLGAINQYTPLPDIPVMGGERLHVSLSSTAGVTGTIFCHVHLSGDMDKPARRRAI